MTGPAALLPLDLLRHALLRLLGQVGVALVRSRSLRVRVTGTLGVAGALAFASVAPVLLLAISPLVFGVPHLVSDVRHLVLGPGLHRRWPVVLALAVPLVVAAAGFVAWGAVLAPAAVLLVARAGAGRRLPILALVALAGAVLLPLGFTAALVLAHVHNLVALAIWWRWRPRGAGDLVVPLAFVAALVAIAAGLADGAIWRFGVADWNAGDHLATLAPGLRAPWDERLVVSFAFAQSVHYAVWVRLVPDEARGRETPRTFAASWRALVADFGRPLMWVCVALWLGLAAWGCVEPGRANLAYLRVALFHGPLEFACLALALAERA